MRLTRLDGSASDRPIVRDHYSVWPPKNLRPAASADEQAHPRIASQPIPKMPHDVDRDALHSSTLDLQSNAAQTDGTDSRSDSWKALLYGKTLPWNLIFIKKNFSTASKLNPTHVQIHAYIRGESQSHVVQSFLLPFTVPI
jgi:hypothetical protein